LTHPYTDSAIKYAGGLGLLGGLAVGIYNVRERKKREEENWNPQYGMIQKFLEQKPR